MTTVVGPPGYRRLAARRGWRLAVVGLALTGLVNVLTTACMAIAYARLNRKGRPA